MIYLDHERLDAIDAAEFQKRTPYPWLNPIGLLHEAAYEALHASLPDVARFDPVFGKERKYGQTSHDRFVLDWQPDLELPDPWREFVAELRGEAYRAFLRRLLGTEPRLRFHWHYTPPGCSVSPHCDSKNKIGSHVFYFNKSSEWRNRWGGQTLILDDGGRFHSDSHPDFGDFDFAVAARSLDNYSLLFMRRGDSWHGVREIRCPEDEMRRVFIVVFERPQISARLKQWLGSSENLPL